MGWLFRPEDTYNYTRLQIVTDQVNYSCEEYSNRVIYGKQYGSTCYLAVKTINHKTGETRTDGLVVLTSIDNENTHNFGTKFISESMGPHYYDAPKKLIELLSPTDSEFAKEWRRGCLESACRQSIRRKNAELLRSLPEGTVIKIGDPCETCVTPYTFSGHRRYKIIGRWARVSTKYILNYGFEVVNNERSTAK